MSSFSTEEGMKASKKAMMLLERMDRTEKGLREKLLLSGFSKEAVEEAVSYVKSFGYINDRRYAQHYISYRLGIKSKQTILQELMQKGVDGQTARDAWEEVTEYESADEKEMIRGLVRKKLGTRQELDEKEMRRLYGYLARRGFRFEDIQVVLNEERIEIKS